MGWLPSARITPGAIATGARRRSPQCTQELSAHGQITPPARPHTDRAVPAGGALAGGDRRPAATVRRSDARRARARPPGPRACAGCHAVRAQAWCRAGAAPGGDRLCAAVHGAALVDLRPTAATPAVERSGRPRAPFRREFRHALFQHRGQLSVEPGPVPRRGELQRQARLLVASGRTRAGGERPCPRTCHRHPRRQLRRSAPGQDSGPDRPQPRLPGGAS
ncbi:hypothetical protein D3C85_700010 [compost metagenome]